MPTSCCPKVYNLSDTPTPSHNTRPTIQNVVPRPQDEIRDINDELDFLAIRLAHLRARKNDILNETRMLRNVVSYFEDLPDDILEVVFLLCLPEGRSPTIDHLEAPLLLTQICRRWRLTAIHTPRLWANLSIAIPFFKDPSFVRRTANQDAPESVAQAKARFQVIGHSFARAVDDWVGHIGGYPLSLSIFQRDHLQVEEDAIFHIVLGVLLQYSAVWHHADIQAPLRNVEALIERHPDDFPILESLSICSTSRMKLSRAPRPFSAYGSQAAPEPDNELVPWRNAQVFEAPRLQSLSLVRLDEPILSLNVRWASLTSLTIEKQGTLGHFGSIRDDIAIDVPIIISLLRQCTNLRYLRMSLTPRAKVPSVDHQELSSPLSLPNLQILIFHEDKSSSRPFFEVLHAPSLRSLEFQTLQKHDSTTTTCSVLPFIRRHGHSLEELIIDTRYMGGSDRLDLYEHLTGMRSLVLKCSDFASATYPASGEQGLLSFTDEDLRRFIPSANPFKLLCPRLEALTCQTLTALSDTELLRFIEERALLGMKKVHATCLTNRKNQTAVVEKLALHESQGMQLDIDYKFKPKFFGTWGDVEGLSEISQYRTLPIYL